MSRKLQGKVALVTGASKGIGASIAKHLAAEGAAVIVNYASSPAGANAVVKEIASAGGKALAVQANVSQPDDARRLVAEATRAFGKLDILVNNAGIYEFGSLEEITPDHFHKQFDINVLGLLLVTQAAVREFNPAGGSIINISSLVSTYAPPNSAVYSGTKAAVDAITLSLSKELGPRKIRVNAINPGMVETEGVQAAHLNEGDFARQILATTPLGRLGRPADIATAAVFLASDDAGWMSGERIVIAGGLR